MRPSNPTRARRQAGLSVIELVTVIAILGIMLGFAVPSFQEFITNYRTSVQTNDLLADLALARGEAVKYSRRTELRSVGAGWTDGWTVGTDLDGDGDIEGDEIIRRHAAAEDGFTIAAGDSGGAATAVITFGPIGTVVVPAGANPLEFAICRPDNDPVKSRAIGLARSGRAESRKAAGNAIFQC
jgi:type IV fimbrial biogenesis protein FimT